MELALLYCFTYLIISHMYNIQTRAGPMVFGYVRVYCTYPFLVFCMDLFFGRLTQPGTCHSKGVRFHTCEPTDLSTAVSTALTCSDISPMDSLILQETQHKLCLLHNLGTLGAEDSLKSSHP